MYAIPLKPKMEHLGTISALPENILDLFLQNTSKKHKFKPLGNYSLGLFFYILYQIRVAFRVA